MVPQLTCSRSRRDKLNNFRNLFTFGANVVILISAILLFKFVDDSLLDFEYMTYIITAIGLPCSIFFISTINEPKLTK